MDVQTTQLVPTQVSDCGAVDDEASTSYVNGSAEAQAADAVLGGTDYNCGKFYAEHLADALQSAKTLLNESAIDRSCSRLLEKMFQ